MSLKKVYEEKYKLLLIIPFALLLFAFVQIGYQYSTTGDFVNKGISLKGGSTITFDYDSSIDIAGLQSFLSAQFPVQGINVRTLSAAGEIQSVAVDSGAQSDEEIDSILAVLGGKVDLKDGSYSVEIVGSSLGESFFRQTASALLIAFILMGIVVFFYFRSVAPTMIVILAAFSDIVVTIAVFNLTGLKLSTAGIAAFLMLIGYSVDSDILLSTRVLKRTQTSLMERVYSSINTGFTMAGTTLAAILVAIIFVQSEVVKQIMIILFIGLLVDQIMTWIQNVGLLRLYLERKEKK